LRSRAALDILPPFDPLWDKEEVMSSTRSRSSLVLSAAFAILAAGCANPGASDLKQDSAPPKAAAKADAKDFKVDGAYVEACSCGAPCPCELVGPEMSCQGVGAYQFDHASYGGEDFSGTKMAYSLHIAKEVRIYLDQPDAKKRAAAEKFCRAMLAGFGPCKGVKDAKIDFGGHDGAYTVKVDGGKTMSLTTEPLLGGDKKTPVVHMNTQDAVNPTMYQGSCVACSYHDGDMKVDLEKGRNSYFNAHMKSEGKI
jgi:hypothetical protein